MAPELAGHLAELQLVSLKVEAMLDLLVAIVDDPEEGELNLRLIEAARDLVAKLNGGLDSGTLLRVGA